MRRIIPVLITLVGLVASVALQPEPLHAAPANGTKGVSQGMIFEATLRSDGLRHLDTPAMINRLVNLNVTLYDYLVWNPQDWPDLVDEFMPAAQNAGIKVLAYLLPPGECPSSTNAPDSCDLYFPYKRDYIAWGTAIGQLAAKYPNLVAWTVDDMDYNLSLFTPAYVKSMRAAAPGIDFYLQLYRPGITQARIDSYATAMDGLIMPYRDDPYSNTIWSSITTLQAQIDAVAAILASRGKRLILMIYGNTLSSSMLAPDSDYVSVLLSQAMSNVKSGKIAGVIVWHMPLSEGVPALRSSNQAYLGVGAMVFTLAPRTATAAGYFVQAWTTLTLDAGSSKCTMVVRRRDTRPTSSPAGYHQKQAFVGGSKVWASDVASDDTNWNTSSLLDVTSRLTNGSATLVLRLAEVKAVTHYSVSVMFDDLKFTGCHVANPTFETDAGWTLGRSGGPVMGSVYQYSATYSSDTFDRIAVQYGNAKAKKAKPKTKPKSKTRH